MGTEETIKRWEADISAKLVGKTIAQTRYLTDKEMDDLGWYQRALVIIFTDGEFIFPSADDEGNDAGALFTSFDGLETIGVI